MIAVDAIASRYTIAGRVKRYPGLAKELAYWNARGIVHQDPTPELLALQAARRAKGPRPGASFPCLCEKLRLHAFGTICSVCGMDGWDVLPHLVRAGTALFIWRDDYGSNGPEGMRYRVFRDGSDDEAIGIVPAFGGAFL